MTTKLPLLLLAAAFLAASPARAESKGQPAEAKTVLHVIVVEPISAMGSAYNDFDRLDLALGRVAKKRSWPVKIDAERLAANQPEHPTELRITLQRVRQDPGEYVFRAWTILVREGEKHDFGIVTYRHSPRLGQNPDDLYDEIFQGGANAIAGKVEPLLFPELKAGKK